MSSASVGIRASAPVSAWDLFPPPNNPATLKMDRAGRWEYGGRGYLSGNDTNGVWTSGSQDFYPDGRGIFTERVGGTPPNADFGSTTYMIMRRVGNWTDTWRPDTLTLFVRMDPTITAIQVILTLNNGKGIPINRVDSSNSHFTVTFQLSSETSGPRQVQINKAPSLVGTQYKTRLIEVAGVGYTGMAPPPLT